MLNSLSDGGFTVQESTSDTLAGLTGVTTSGTVTVSLVLHVPGVTNVATTENTQTTAGLVITPDPADAAFVTSFQVTNITGGTLFQNDGTTPINNGDFITTAQGAAGLKFTPALNSLTPGRFTVQESTSPTTAGLGGLAATDIITITGQPPTDISLTSTSVAEGQPSGTLVGIFSTSDPNAGDSFTYSLVSGDGSTNNASFTILGNSLRTAETFNAQAKSSYSIRVRSIDLVGAYVDKVFTIVVTHVDQRRQISPSRIRASRKRSRAELSSEHSTPPAQMTPAALPTALTLALVPTPTARSPSWGTR